MTLSKQGNFFSRMLVGTELAGTKGCLIFFLIMVTAFGASGFCAASELASTTSWDTSSSSTIHHHFFDTVVQQNGIMPESRDLYGLGTKDSPEQGSILVAGSLNYLILNPGSKAFLNLVNSFQYILIYGYSPLRSPPTFS